MEIQIIGKFEPGNPQKQINHIPWMVEGFVFVQYLFADIFLGDLFILEDGTEISLQEIKL